MVSWKAKKVSIVFRAELARVEEPGRAIRQNENPARFPRAGSREPSCTGLAIPGLFKLAKKELNFKNLNL